MRTPILTLLAVLWAQSATPAAAQEACNACLKAAAGEGNKCQEAAKGPADGVACDKIFATKHRQCALGACKGTPHAEQTPCKGCREFARVEVAKCVATIKAPVDRSKCDKQAAEMGASCNERFCSAEKSVPIAKPAPGKADAKAMAPAKPAAP